MIGVFYLTLKARYDNMRSEYIFAVSDFAGQQTQSSKLGLEKAKYSHGNYFQMNGNISRSTENWGCKTGCTYRDAVVINCV